MTKYSNLPQEEKDKIEIAIDEELEMTNHQKKRILQDEVCAFCWLDEQRCICGE